MEVSVIEQLEQMERINFFKQQRKPKSGKGIELNTSLFQFT